MMPIVVHRRQPQVSVGLCGRRTDCSAVQVQPGLQHRQERFGCNAVQAKVRLAHPLVGVAFPIPEFAWVASACRLRSCLSDWDGSLPRSPLGDAGQRVRDIPVSTRLSRCVGDRDPDDSTLALLRVGRSWCDAWVGSSFCHHHDTLASSAQLSRATATLPDLQRTIFAGLFCRACFNENLQNLGISGLLGAVYWFTAKVVGCVHVRPCVHQ